MSQAPSTPQSWSLSDWDQQGMNDNQGAAFAQQVQHITPLKLFIRALPAWCQAHQAGVTITITAHPSLGGVGIEFGFDQKQLPVGAAQQLIDQLMDTSHLMELELAAEVLREGGAPPEAVNQVVTRADALAAQLQARSQEPI